MHEGGREKNGPKEEDDKSFHLVSVKDSECDTEHKGYVL